MFHGQKLYSIPLFWRVTIHISIFKFLRDYIKKVFLIDQGRQVAEGTVRMRLKREAGLEGYSSGSDQQVRRPWDTVRASVAGVEWGRGEDGGVHRRPRG